MRLLSSVGATAEAFLVLLFPRSLRVCVSLIDDVIIITGSGRL